MWDQIVVLPLDHLAFIHLVGHRIKLKIPYRNLNDSRCNGGCKSIGRSVAIASVLKIPRANQERAADDDHEHRDSEKPKSQYSATSARLASLGLNYSMHILRILSCRAIHWLAMKVHDRVVCFNLRSLPSRRQYSHAGPFGLVLGAICSMKPAAFSHVPNEQQRLAGRFRAGFLIQRSWCLGSTFCRAN